MKAGVAQVAMPQKYEQEIDEILRRMDSRKLRVPFRRRLGRRFAGLASIISPLPKLRPTPTGLLLAGLMVALLGYLLRSFVPGVGTPLIVLALALFIGALALSVFRSRRRSAPGWRGRRIEYRPTDPLIWSGLARRVKAWRDSRRRRSRF
jgi:hypothetical protein